MRNLGGLLASPPHCGKGKSWERAFRVLDEVKGSKAKIISSVDQKELTPHNSHSFASLKKQHLALSRSQYFERVAGSPWGQTMIKAI